MIELLDIINNIGFNRKYIEIIIYMQLTQVGIIPQSSLLMTLLCRETVPVILNTIRQKRRNINQDIVR